MSDIIRTEDPATGEEIVIVKGVVEAIKIDEIQNDRYGNTHRASIKVGDTWVGMINLRTKEGFEPSVRINTGNRASPNWQQLDQGDEVRVVVKENEYNGRIYYNSGVSKITLVKKGEGGGKEQSSRGSQKPSTAFKRDNSGVVAGNGFNAAKAFLAGQEHSNEEFIETAIKLVDIGQEIREELKKERPDLDEYSIGAQSGMALIAACEWTDDIAEVKDLSKEILSDILPAITEHVKSVQDPQEKPKAVAKKAVKKATKKASAKKEATPENVDDEDIPVEAYEGDLDDDIPF